MTKTASPLCDSPKCRSCTRSRKRLPAARKGVVKALEGLGMEDEADGGTWHLNFGCDSISYGKHQCPEGCRAARAALKEYEEASK